MSEFKDFIPEGQPTGAVGNSFTDFVPEKEPEIVKIEKPAKKKVTKKVVKAVKAEKPVVVAVPEKEPEIVKEVEK